MPPATRLPCRIEEGDRRIGLPEESDGTWGRATCPPPDAPTDGLQAEDHELKLTYRAKSSQGVRMTAGPNALATLPEMLADVSQGRVTVVPPLDSVRPHGRSRPAAPGGGGGVAARDP